MIRSDLCTKRITLVAKLRVDGRGWGRSKNSWGACNERCWWLGLGCSSKGKAKWSNSGSVLQIKSMGFADKCVGSERKRRVRFDSHTNYGPKKLGG